MGEKISLGPGTLYIESEPLGIIGELDVTESIYDKPETPIMKMSEEVTIEGTCKLNWNIFLDLIYTINFRKMHGIPMKRGRAYKKIKRN